MKWIGLLALGALTSLSASQSISLTWGRDTAGGALDMVLAKNGDGVFVLRENGVCTRYNRYGAVKWGVQLDMASAADVARLSDGSYAVVGTALLAGKNRMVIQEVLEDGTKLTRIIDSAAGTYQTYGRCISGSELGTAPDRRPRFIAGGARRSDSSGYMMCVRAPTPDGNTATFKPTVTASSSDEIYACLSDRNGDFWYLARQNDNSYVFGRATKTSVSNVNQAGLVGYSVNTRPLFLLEMPGTAVGDPSYFALVRQETALNGWTFQRAFVNRTTNALTTLQQFSSSAGQVVNATVDDGRLLISLKLNGSGVYTVANYDQNGALQYSSQVGAWGSTSLYAAHQGGIVFATVYVNPTNSTNRLHTFEGNAFISSNTTTGGITRALLAPNRFEIYLLAYGDLGTRLRKFATQRAVQTDLAYDTVYAGQPIPYKVYGSAIATAPTQVNLESTNAALVVPASITLPTGSGVASGTAETRNVTAPTAATLRGAIVSQPWTSDAVMILPNQPKTAKFASATVQGGSNASFSFTLQAAAAQGGLNLTLTSTKPGTIPVPASTLVAQGQAQKTLSLSTNAVVTNTAAVVSVSANGVTKAASITITP